MPPLAQTTPLSRKRFRIYSTLARAERSLAIPIRVEKYGLQHSLYNASPTSFRQPAGVDGHIKP